MEYGFSEGIVTSYISEAGNFLLRIVSYIYIYIYIYNNQSLGIIRDERKSKAYCEGSQCDCGGGEIRYKIKIIINKIFD